MTHKGKTDEPAATAPIAAGSSLYNTTSETTGIVDAEQRVELRPAGDKSYADPLNALEEALFAIATMLVEVLDFEYEPTTAIDFTIRSLDHLRDSALLIARQDRASGAPITYRQGEAIPDRHKQCARIVALCRAATAVGDAPDEIWCKTPLRFWYEQITCTSNVEFRDPRVVLFEACIDLAHQVEQGWLEARFLIEGLLVAAMAIEIPIDDATMIIALGFGER